MTKVDRRLVGSAKAIDLGESWKIVGSIRRAAQTPIVVTRRGKPAAVIIGFASGEDWEEYRLEHDERFLDRIAAARADIKAGRWKKLENL